MDSQANPDFLVSQMRVLTMPEMTFFYVAGKPTAFADLDQILDPLLACLYEAKAQANIAEAGPDIVRYYRANADDGPADAVTGEPNLWLMEVGVPVKLGTPPMGRAQVKTLPPYHCAALLLWGSLAHVVQAHSTLAQAVEQAGWKRTGESREWNYWFEAVNSPHNLLGLYFEIVRHEE